MKDLTHILEPRLDFMLGAYLRPIQPDDVTVAYVEGLNDPRVNRFLIGPARETQTVELVTGFVTANFNACDGQLFGLFVESELCGTLRLHDVTDDGAYIGIAIFVPEQWGKGLGAKMVSAVSHYALHTLGVRAVRAGIDAVNVASQRVFAKAGFKHRDELDKRDGQKISQVWERSAGVS